MTEVHKFDVAIVGGGISGLVAGVRLAELGQQVAVLEQGEQERYLCNSRFTGGLFHVCFLDLAGDESVLVDAIKKSTHDSANPDLAEAVAKDTRVAVQWMKTHGVRFIKSGPEGWRQHVLEPPGLTEPGLHWEGLGGDVMLQTLSGALKARGSELLLGMRAVRLRVQNGRCLGLEGEQRGKRTLARADNVLLCDGGFQANHELMREFVTPAPEKLRQRGAVTGNGDGLRMAREIGAQLVGMPNFYGHLLCQDALRDDGLWPYPVIDFIAAAGLVVDGSGRRFMDEGRGGVYMANCVARLRDPLSATAIFDETIWNGPARDFILPANPHLVSAGGTILKAANLSELARKIGLPDGGLEASVSQYNAAVDTGETTWLDPPRTTLSYRAYPVRHAPFCAVRLCAGVTYTMGGIAIDGTARVLDKQNKPIPGLYAAGCTTGGLEGGEFAGYVGGLAKSAVTAWRAANAIAGNRAP